MESNQLMDDRKYHEIRILLRIRRWTSVHCKRTMCSVIENKYINAESKFSSFLCIRRSCCGETFLFCWPRCTRCHVVIQLWFLVWSVKRTRQQVNFNLLLLGCCSLFAAQAIGLDWMWFHARSIFKDSRQSAESEAIQIGCCSLVAWRAIYIFMIAYNSLLSCVVVAESGIGTRCTLHTKTKLYRRRDIQFKMFVVRLCCSM